MFVITVSKVKKFYKYSCAEGHIMAEFKQKLLIYLLCLLFFGSAVSFPVLANAAGSSMQGYGGSRLGASYTETEDEPRFFRMIGDLIIGRPLLLAATGLGTGIFLASLPFSLLGGNVKEAANTLVVGPARQTFVRCLGCRLSTLGPNQYHYSNTPVEEDPAYLPLEKNLPTPEAPRN